MEGSWKTNIQGPKRGLKHFKRRGLGEKDGGGVFEGG